MRTRRIAIGCRRTRASTTVTVAPADLPAEFLPIDLTPGPMAAHMPTAPESEPVSQDDGMRPVGPPLPWPPALPASPPLDAPIPFGRDTLPRRVPPGGHPVPVQTGASWDRDLTLADLTTGRRDLAWNDNPGWPAEIDWTQIARMARGHSPRHARRRLPGMPQRVFTWTGAGIITAVLLTVLVTTIGELVR